MIVCMLLMGWYVKSGIVSRLSSSLNSESEPNLQLMNSVVRVKN